MFFQQADGRVLVHCESAVAVHQNQHDVDASRRHLRNLSDLLHDFLFGAGGVEQARSVDHGDLPDVFQGHRVGLE